MTELASVIWAVQMSTVEFHPWHSRRADTERPDELRIDLDPQPGTDFEDAKVVAVLVHELLTEIGAVGWPKTSGSRGIHIYLRIHPDHGFTQVRRAALAFAREVERRVPDLVTTKWWKEERGEQIFIDFNQNARDRTIASAYSIRASTGLVSAPISWDELPEVRMAGLHHGRPCRPGSPSSVTCMPASTIPLTISGSCSNGRSATSRTTARATRRTRRTSRRWKANRRGCSRRRSTRPTGPQPDQPQPDAGNR